MKEKIVQIYEVMANITLNRLNAIKEAGVMPCEDTLEMVRTTQSLYETLNRANQPMIATASVRDVSSNLENDCKYTDRPGAADFGDFVPRDSDGTKYSLESSSLARPTATHEQNQ